MDCTLPTRPVVGSANEAADRALIRQARAVPVFAFRSYAPTVSIGGNDLAAYAAREAYCRANDIAVVRRMTGGGALYHDPDQLCWTFAAPLDVLPGGALTGWMGRLGRAATRALAAFGVLTDFQRPNDIEAGGRKLGALFATRLADVGLFQGVLLLDADVPAMLKALRMPTEKLTAEGILNARERYATLLGLGLPEEAVPSLAARLAAECESAFAIGGFRFGAAADAGVRAGRVDGAGISSIADTAFVATGGGVLRAELEADAENRVRRARLSGTVQAAPGNLFDLLAASLIGAPLREAAQAVARSLERMRPDLLDFGQADLARVVELAAARTSQRARLQLSRAEANTVMLHEPGGGTDAEAVLARAGVMLVPYCAKPVSCKWRHRDGCPECGECEVGDAYCLARERGMRVVTITNFEHLQATFAEMRGEGVEAYVGMCCGDFYLKRHRAFTEAGIPGVLLDISGANCYELGEEELAYQGRFAAQARLNGPVVEKVMRFVPPLEAAVTKGRG